MTSPSRLAGITHLRSLKARLLASRGNMPWHGSETQWRALQDLERLLADRPVPIEEFNNYAGYIERL